MRLVELGPGRGTLMADLLRGTAPFKPFISGLDIHLVEVFTHAQLQQAVTTSGLPQLYSCNRMLKTHSMAIMHCGTFLSDSVPV